jgi:hypothetical protein
MTDARRDQVMMEMHSSLSTLIAAVAKVETAINGNGKPGLLDRMTVIEERQAACPARQSYQIGARQQRSANIISIGALAVAALSWFKALGWIK